MTVKAWIAAIWVIAGCKDLDERCHHDQDAEACRSLCRTGNTGACGYVAYAEARSGDGKAQERLCNNGDMFMCVAVADRQPDAASRRKVLEDACAQGENGAPACAHLADMITDPAEKRRLLERTCAMRWGLLACGRLADIEPDPSVKAKRLAAVCVRGLEEKCAMLVEVEPSPAARRALILRACDENAEACALHPVEWALRAAKLPVEARDAGR